MTTITRPAMTRAARTPAGPPAAANTRWNVGLLALLTLLVLNGAVALNGSPKPGESTDDGAAAAARLAAAPRVRLVKSAHRATPVLTAVVR
jgi:hypothetical protein